MKRVVVTGAKGGTGRSIVSVLRGAGYDVLGLDLATPGHTEAGYVRADVLDGQGLHDLFRGADAVVHFGSLPTDHWSSASEAFRNIVLGGFNVLQACANLAIRRVVLASSIEVYGDLARQPHLPITEESPLQTTSIYGTSKVLLERLAADYCRWSGMAIAALRLGRIIFEDSFAWRLRPHTQSEERGRDALWCYVDARDVATACQAWLESDVAGFRAFNLAAEEVCLEVPIRRLLGRFLPNLTDIRRELGEHETPFDSGALRRTLGWRPRHHWRMLRDEAEGQTRR